MEALVISRRTFLTSTAAATAGVAVAGALDLPARAAADDEFATLRATWRGLILGSGFDATAEPFATKLAAMGRTASGYAAGMSPADGSLWPGLVWADPDPDTDTESYAYSATIQTSYQRLYAMAEAWAQPGTGVTGDATLAAAVITGLDHMYARIYHESQTRYGNWYNWQIGAPQSLLDAAVLLHDQLSAEQIASYCRAVDHFVPDSAVTSYTGTSTGANRIDLCRVLAVRGALGADSAKLALASSAIAPVFPYVTSGDGLYADGSVIQHTWVPYTGSYGAVLLDGLSRLLALLAGSTWAVTSDDKQIIFDAVENAYAPFLHNGLCMDGVSGRAVSRGLVPAEVSGLSSGQNDDHLRGHAIMSAIVALGRSAGTEENTRWRGLVKGWIDRAYYRSPATDLQLSVAKLALINDVLHDDTVDPVRQPVASSLFPAMDRAVHRRPGWVASVSMASKRITYYENGNGENLRGFHTGSGMLYWWGDRYANDQYSDRFWPTVDPYRLPGTTASSKRLADGEGGIWGAARPDVDFVGGATDGTYSVLGQHLKGLSSTLEARKSWFLLDDAIICLGSGITATDGVPVETIVENRHLGATGTDRLTVDGAHVVDSPSLPRTRWAHLSGHAGYLFPDRPALNTLREQRTGAWHDINSATGPATTFTSRYLTLWFDHGSAPVDATYAYVLLPGASAAETAVRSLALNAWLTGREQSATVHGVQVPSLGLLAANFWQAGSFGGVTVDAPCSVLVRQRRDGTAVLAVSDPSRLTDTVTLTSRRFGQQTFGGLIAAGGRTQQRTVRLR